MNLAIKGGKKLRSHPFPKHPIIGDEEKKQVLDVLDSGKKAAVNVRGVNGGKLLCEHPTKKILLVNKVSRDINDHDRSGRDDDSNTDHS